MGGGGRSVEMKGRLFQENVCLPASGAILQSVAAAGTPGSVQRKMFDLPG